MKRTLAVLLVVIAIPALLAARDDWKKWEFSVLGGYGFGSIEAASSYHYIYSTPLIDTISESTDIALAKRNSFSPGAILSYFLTPNFGLQLGGGSFAPEAGVSSSYTFAWQSTFLGLSDSLEGSWPSTKAKLTSVALYLNFIAKYRTGNLGFYASAGPAIYFNTFKADTFGLWTNYYHYGEFIDYFRISVAVPETSWTPVGFNAGAGLEVGLIPAVALVAEGRYFYCPSKTIFWKWAPGVYDGEPYWASGNHFAGQGFGGSLPDFYNSLMSPLTINPSFFAILAGIKFRW